MAGEFSTSVIKGVSCTTLEGAKALVAAGEAEPSDFYVCAGYSGWAPGQLQMEVEKRDSWYMASADSATLLAELLRQAKTLPPPSTDSAAADLLGTETWSALMRGIGREDDVAKAEGSLADKMLSEWVRSHLLPKPKREAPSAPPPSVGVGTVLCTAVAPSTGRPADRCLLREQFLHKAILLVLAEATDGTLSACVLNRPTSTIAQFKSVLGSPKRRVGYTGSREIGGLLWLHHRSDLGTAAGMPVGESGTYVLQEAEASSLLKAGTLNASDVFVVSSVVQFSRAELSGMLAAGEARPVSAGPQLESLWPRVWGLMEANGLDAGDGTGVWWLASQAGAEQPGSAQALAALPTSELADEALAEWTKFFAN